MNLIRSVLLCGLVISLNACGSSKPIDINTIAVERARLNLEYPPHVSLESPKWVVITPQNSIDVFKKLSTNTDTAALYGLTREQYQQLSIDMANIRQYMIISKEIIKKYKEYYEPAP